MKRLLAILLLAAACGGSKKADTTNAAVLAPVELELGELKLIDVNKNAIVFVKADGAIEIDGKVIAKVTADGKIIAAGSNETFTLRGDGSITAPDGIPVEVKLTTDAVIQSGDKTISLDATTGELVGANPDAPKMKIEGATTTGLRRTALFVLIALTTPKSPS